MTPIKAIRTKCLDCMGGSKSGVAHCVDDDCPLYLFRFGKDNNKRARQPREEHEIEEEIRIRKLRRGEITDD